MITFCRKHQQFEKIIGYDRDDPILECGIIKKRTILDDRLTKCKQDIDKFLISQSVCFGISVEDARDNLITDLLRGSYAGSSNILNMG